MCIDVGIETVTTTRITAYKAVYKSGDGKFFSPLSPAQRSRQKFRSDCGTVVVYQVGYMEDTKGAGYYLYTDANVAKRRFPEGVVLRVVIPPGTFVRCGMHPLYGEFGIIAKAIIVTEVVDIE